MQKRKTDTRTIIKGYQSKAKKKKRKENKTPHPIDYTYNLTLKTACVRYRIQQYKLVSVTS